MTGTDNCRKNSFKTPATTCTVYSSKLTRSIPESARDNAGKKKNTINRRWWKQGWDQVCLDTLLFPCSLRKQPTFRDAATGFPAKWRLRNEYRNSIMMTYRYPDSDWLCCLTNLLQPIRSTTQIRAVTRHQYRISVLVSHFRGETSGGCFLGVFSVSL